MLSGFNVGCVYQEALAGYEVSRPSDRSMKKKRGVINVRLALFNSVGRHQSILRSPARKPGRNSLQMGSGTGTGFSLYTQKGNTWAAAAAPASGNWPEGFIALRFAGVKMQSGMAK